MIALGVAGSLYAYFFETELTNFLSFLLQRFLKILHLSVIRRWC